MSAGAIPHWGMWIAWEQFDIPHGPSKTDRNPNRIVLLAAGETDVAFAIGRIPMTLKTSSLISFRSRRGIEP